MSTAREEILARVHSALADIHDGDPEVNAPIDWSYAEAVELDGELLDVFAERVAEYRATVVRCTPKDLPNRVASAIADLGADSMLVPPGLERGWLSELPSEVRLVTEDEPLSPERLNDIAGVITAAAVGIADTGTIIMDHGPDQGRRALTLVPDRHVCVVRASQVVSGVAEAVARVKPAVTSGQPLTWISGPSATSDIELSRVEGVHGPRNLYVILVAETD